MEADMKSGIKLRTGVSTAFWCFPIGDEYDFCCARIPKLHTPSEELEEIAWLDKLFEGGILLPQSPEHTKRAISVLLTGPPGTWKSTLAMELCYRLTTNTQIRQSGLSSLYITSEADEDWIIEKARSFDWKDIDRIFLGDPSRTQGSPIPLVTVWQSSDFREFLLCEEDLSDFQKVVIKSMARLLRIEPVHGELAAARVRTRIRDKIKMQDPDILVIDSLNTIEETDRPELFKRFVDIALSGPKIILIILDSGTEKGHINFWEYICDILIRLDRTYISDYMIRTIEILKARYQSHIWGRHQLKIYGPLSKTDLDSDERRRAHPYREEGGIFIFPSIHYYLSSYKRHAPKEKPDLVKTPNENLNAILKGGFPEGRCTGFIGTRGGHKSHLGYIHLLSRIINTKDEKGLIISLRDDEGMAKKTMEKILSQEFPEEKYDLDDFEKNNRLEILYYPPGYITPEEFFHRMLMSIHRLKQGKSKAKITLLFNSLDQLSSRFPLCAKEDIFVPGIISALTAEEVTSIFIAVEEPGQPPEQYGLFSMAELIISFKQKRLQTDDYCEYLTRSLRFEDPLSVEDLNMIKDQLGPSNQVVVLTVVRFAGGQAAGAEGILELIDQESPVFMIYNTEGLHFIPF
jgi:KaiC/GvpD/RAD55 family RecA-like ATPase